MKTLKYSRQRESIKQYLEGRKDHPTADSIYLAIREQYPNISLGTVYRNLSLLTDLGEISKISCGDIAEHFDGNPKPHYHFICLECKKVQDLEMDSIDFINTLAGKTFDGEIMGHQTHFYGKCADCKKC